MFNAAVPVQVLPHVCSSSSLHLHLTLKQIQRRGIDKILLFESHSSAAASQDCPSRVVFAGAAADSRVCLKRCSC